jgi:hypothetical protein
MIDTSANASPGEYELPINIPKRQVETISYSSYVRFARGSNYGKNPAWKVLSYKDWWRITVHGLKKV